MSKVTIFCLIFLFIGVFTITPYTHSQTLTITPENQGTYNDWEPTDGSTLTFTVAVSGLTAASITAGEIRFDFETVSNWTGTCMNDGDGTDPDLNFTDTDQTTYTAPRWTQWSGATQNATASWNSSDSLDSFSINITVRCKDYGAFGILRAKLYNTSSSDVFLYEVSIAIPKDDNGNYIADKSDTDYGYTYPAIDAESGPDTSSITDPNVEKNENPGDGLVEFEEYRGFKVNGVHKRLKPADKDIFVHSKFTTVGIGDASNLPSVFEVHGILKTETFDEHRNRTVNYNSLGTPTQFGAGAAWRVQDTKALWVYKSGSGSYLGKVTREDRQIDVGAPPDIERIDIYESNISGALYSVQQGTPRTDLTLNEYIANVIGHEIGHALAVNHPWHTKVPTNQGDPPDYAGWYGFSGNLSNVRIPTGSYSADYYLSSGQSYWDRSQTTWTIPVNTYTDDLPMTNPPADYKYRFGSTVMDFELPFADTTDANGNTIDREGIFPESTYHRLHNWEYQLLGDGVSSQKNASWTPRPGATNPLNGGDSDDEPGEPTNVSVSSGNGEVTLSWDAPTDTGSSGISDYEYRYSSQQDANGNWINWTEWESAGSDDTEVDITGLTNGTLYAFQVRTESGTFYSTGTDVETEKPSTIPDAPTNLTATGYNGWIYLSWTAPNDNGAAIEDYDYRYTGSNGSSLSWASAGDISSNEPIRGLTNGVLYTFEVRAENSNGEGPASSSVSATPKGPPGAPQNFQTAAGDGEVTLTWEAPLTNNGSAITGYKYSYYAGTSGTFNSWTSVDANVLTVTVSGLTNDTLYQFGVLATNGVGNGPYAGPESATPEAITPPGAPTGLTVVAAQNGYAIFTWSAPDDDGGAEITGYKYRYREKNTLNWGSWSDTTYTTEVIAGLTNGTTYEIQVLAVNSEGDGTISDPLEATPVVVEVKPGAPKDLTATAGDEEVDLDWYPPDFDGNTPITGYQYRLDTNNDGSWAAWTDTDNGTYLYVTVTGLTNGIEYAFQVRAKNSIGKGGPSSKATATPEEEITVPNRPTGLSTTTGTATGTIDLSWTAPSDDGGSPITGYTYGYTKLQPNGRWGKWTSFSSTGSTSTSYTATGLESGGFYRFSVCAVNDIGSSRSSRVANTHAR